MEVNGTFAKKQPMARSYTPQLDEVAVEIGVHCVQTRRLGRAPFFRKYLWSTCSRQTFRENCRGGGSRHWPSKYL